MEYKIKALKVSSIRGYIVVLEEYSLPEKYTTYRVHLHIPGIKQIFKDYPSTAINMGSSIRSKMQKRNMKRLFLSMQISASLLSEMLFRDTLVKLVTLI